jgi:hypothetical protein
MADSLVAGPNPQCSGRGLLDTIDLNGTDLGRRSGKMRAPKAPATERPEPLIGSCWVRSQRANYGQQQAGAVTERSSDPQVTPPIAL